MAQEFQTVEEFHGYLQGKAAEDEEFRSRLLADARSVMEDELDISIPDGFNIEVHEESATTAHLVLPPSAVLTEDSLSVVSGGHAMDWCSPV